MTRFEVAEPSLEALFIELVGRSPDIDAPSAEPIVDAAGARPTAGLA